MRRALSTFNALLFHQKITMLDTSKLLSDFKDFKFKSPPNYAELPINENPEYNVPVAVNNAIFSKVPTEPLTGKLHLVCASEEALTDILDLNPKVADSEEFIDFVAGKYQPEGSLSVCHRYGGYQFGFWADQLGDGRAHILGEYVNSLGLVLAEMQEQDQDQDRLILARPRTRLTMQDLSKNKTKLARLLRLAVRTECRFSEDRNLVSDDHKVWRDKTYSGRARQERAAVVIRLAPAWYRIGSFEILLKRREPDLARKLADFIVTHHFPDISINDEDRYVKLFCEVAHRNLDMVATWQGIGFTHGVLNTDNISLLGVTIDYGPYGFIDHFYNHYVPNSSDDMGRYAYKMQPEILLWNLDKFVEALIPILSVEQINKIRDIQSTLEKYVEDKISKTFNSKLGLETNRDGDNLLVKDLMSLMEETSADFTATFRQLAEVRLEDLCESNVLENHWSLKKVGKAKNWDQWVERYRERVGAENVSDDERRARMLRVNPLYVPRNWILQEAIADAENNDFKKEHFNLANRLSIPPYVQVRHLLEVFKKPFEVNLEAEELGYSAQPPSWSYGLKLSCSS